ncbi:LIM-type zinc finger-containing protein [Tieghemostelium lacteum]|uniref:Cysteine-rich protein 1 n=1 Tax=Tieghemostelium lacteum TaxID=361077 RepID=A0A152A375_TIELA|nr:LIM-type zinc finger-containing protein [Tieghemostelium lacteum]|eukprot:KYR00555.1 LIM-type zinc finger-containing protein [Tieghemostelium lacteum]
MSEICPGCEKRCYAAEWVNACGKKWHKLCLKCTHCNQLLQAGQFPDREGKPYCKTDYDRLFRVSGYGHGGVTDSFDPIQKVDAQTPEAVPPVTTFDKPVQSDEVTLFDKNCPKCGKAAFFSEKKIYNGRDWHKTCFCCFTCNKSLVSGQYSEKQGLIYCPRCYESKYGSKGFGFGGSVVLH